MPQSPLAFVANAISNLGVLGGFGSGRLDAERALWTAARHGNNYEAAVQKTMFMAENASGATTSAALATTYVGFCLSNPAASGKNLVIQRVSGLVNVAPAALTAYSLAVGYAAGGVTAHTTPITPLSSFVDGATTPVAKVDAACTLVGTPAYALPLSETPGATSSLSFTVALDGAVILPPGAWAAIVSSIAGPTAGFIGGMIWEEVTA